MSDPLWYRILGVLLVAGLVLFYSFGAAASGFMLLCALAAPFSGDVVDDALGRCVLLFLYFNFALIPFGVQSAILHVDRKAYPPEWDKP